MAAKKKIQIASKEEIEQYGPSANATEGPAGSKPESETIDTTEAALEQNVAALRRQIDELTEKLLRVKADFQNFQRRAREERADALRYANADLIRSVLGVLDDFERGLEAANADNASAESVTEGMQLVYASLQKVLKDHHVSEIGPDGEAFDPRRHEAVMQRPSDDHPNMTVLETVQKGYTHHDRVLRPAKVIVSKCEQSEDSADPQPATDSPPTTE